MYYTEKANSYRLGWFPINGSTPPLSTPPFNPTGDSILLKGRIVDISTNKPLEGAHVYYLRNGVKIGSTTDLNGEYELQAEPTDIITISFLGFETVTLKASEIQKTEYLDPKYEQLNEVVVTAPKKNKNNTMLYLGLGILGFTVALITLKKE